MLQWPLVVVIIHMPAPLLGTRVHPVTQSCSIWPGHGPLFYMLNVTRLHMCLTVFWHSPPLSWTQIISQLKVSSGQLLSVTIRHQTLVSVCVSLCLTVLVVGAISNKCQVKFCPVTCFLVSAMNIYLSLLSIVNNLKKSNMEESTLALAQSLARQTIYEESPPGSPKSGRSHAQLLKEKVQGFR